MPLPASNEDYQRYLPLFRKICWRYVRPGVEMDDLLQMAYFGLYDAVNKWTEESGVNFEAYLSGCVRNAVLSGLNAPGAYGNVPYYARKQAEKLERVKEKLARSLMRVPYKWEIAREMGASDDELSRTERYGCLVGSVSLDAPQGEYDGITLLTLVVSDGKSASDDIELRELRTALWPLVGKVLTSRECEIVHGHYARGMPMVKLSKIRGEPVQRTYGIHRQALDKLRRHKLIRRIGRDYGYYGTYRHVGVNEFKRTWTSATEDEVLRREEWREKHGKRVREEIL